MGKKILVIDDNEQDRKVIKRFLNKAGYEEISMAQRGMEGLTKAGSERPELVITDTLLPDIDGFEVCRRIKENKASAGPPKVIIITGSIDAVDAVRAKKSGADDYCAKTSDYSALLEAVKQLI